ncbi:MAG: sulfite exporter TauE/SafE family protein [Helicobacteraceae bacterium]|nr:sulfite exporter TauE/SafE family protein [Candidatus Sulfurimonas ponti]MBL6973670.1 sulfite exporter TauE/SafE family protein [Sulfurimonas sp.]
MQETILTLVESNSLLAFLGAFGAGSITAIAPCSLISVPLLVGSSVALNKDLEGKKKVFYTYAFATLFALGVMISFSILGLIVAKFGGFFSVAPIWAYILASVFSLLIGLYAWGIFGTLNKSSIMAHLIKYRLFGGFLIGIIFGLVSTPCASAPLVTIITVAANSGYIYAYGLILTFALGHSMLLLIAGVSVGFTQSVTSNKLIARVSNYINKGFAIMLIGIGIYFSWQAYVQF